VFIGFLRLPVKEVVSKSFAFSCAASSAGANGVILITTKMGKKNSKEKLVTIRILVSGNFKNFTMLNATEYALLLNESYANGGNAIPFPNVSGLGRGTNWQRF
jgi:hypothetical protein